MERLAAVLDQAIFWFHRQFPDLGFLSEPFFVRSLLAVLLVSLICGSVGSMVAGNRMAFFSDALAHCAFAGVALGFLLALIQGVSSQSEFYPWVTPVMVIFGVTVGIGIAFVRENTTLASDTVIGVFFAGAMGFGAMLLSVVTKRKYFSPENFLFGDAINARSTDLLRLALLAAVTLAALGWMYNDLVFTSFNPSLARSRQIRVRLYNYLFIVLLAVVINLCLQVVGVLLINAMLIVPAATASNLCKNMRQLFWVTVTLCLLAGALGQWLSWAITVDLGPGAQDVSFSVGGLMVVLSVSLFFLSLLWRLGRQRLDRVTALGADDESALQAQDGFPTIPQTEGPAAGNPQS